MASSRVADVVAMGVGSRFDDGKGIELELP